MSRAAPAEEEALEMDLHTQLEEVRAARIEVVEWRPLVKGESLKGFLTLQLPSGLVLYDCTLHQRSNGSRWISMPARSYTGKDGTTSSQRLVGFADRTVNELFQRHALKAVDEYFTMIEAARKL